MKPHLAILAGLLAVAIAVQAIVIGRAVLPAQDAVRFVQAAQAIDRHGLAALAETQRPLPPALIFAAHRMGQAVGVFESSAAPLALDTPVRSYRAAGDWALCAQLVAACMAVLTVPAVYLLLLRLVSPKAAIVGGFLLCILSEFARLGADGMSDSTQLCLLAWALLAMMLAQPAAAASETNSRRLGWLLLAGLLVGAGALCRREILLLLPSWLVVQAWLRWHSSTRMPPLRHMVAAMLLAAGFVAGASPMLVLSGGDVNAATARLVQTGAVEADDGISRAVRKQFRWKTDEGQRMSFPKKDPTDSLRLQGWWSALIECGKETSRAGDYWALCFAPAGLWAAWRKSRGWRFWRRDGAVSAAIALAGAYVLLHGLGCLVYSTSVGYLAARHVLPAVAVCIGLSAEGWLLVAGAAVSAGRRALAAMRLHLPHPWSPNLHAALAAGVVAAASLPHTLAPLHVSRQAHRSAGEWLREHARPHSLVLDSRGWTGLYSDRETLTYDQAMRAFTSRGLGYVVIERHEVEHRSVRSQTLQSLLRHAGRRVAVFPASTSRKCVEVFCWDPDRFDERFAKKPRTPPPVSEPGGAPAPDPLVEGTSGEACDECAPQSDPTL